MDYIYYDNFGTIKMLSLKALYAPKLNVLKKKLTKKEKKDIIDINKDTRIKNKKLN